MPLSEPIEIYYNKTAYGFGFFAALIIFCLGLCMLTVIQNGSLDFSIHPFTEYGILGIILLLAGTFLGYVFQKKLFSTAPAMVIDDQGITINNKKQTFIGWDKIERIDVKTSNLTNNSYSTNPARFIVPVLKILKLFTALLLKIHSKCFTNIV